MTELKTNIGATMRSAPAGTGCQPVRDGGLALTNFSSPRYPIPHPYGDMTRSRCSVPFGKAPNVAAEAPALPRVPLALLALFSIGWLIAAPTAFAQADPAAEP